MTNKIASYYKDLPGWAKGVIAVGGLAVGYFAVRGFINRIKSQANLQKELQTQKDVKAELERIKRAGVKPSFSTAQFKAWADKIEKQYSGADTTFLAHYIAAGWSGSGGTTKDIIVRLKNDADFLSLVDAYGIRKYDQAGWFTGDFTGNLYQAVQDELSRDEIRALNALLEKQKINYKL